MSDGVKFIFKSLIKVPVIIFVAFFILNIFAFFFIYFRLLGLSYIVMQETVDKNYIASRQLYQFQSTLKQLDNIGMVQDGTAGIIIGVDSHGNEVFVNSDLGYYSSNDNGEISTSSIGAAQGGPFGSAVTKCQYGAIRHVGIRVNYEIIWPLDVSNITRHDNESQYSPDGTVEYKKSTFSIPITITYDVPGLKYYADED